MVAIFEHSKLGYVVWCFIHSYVDDTKRKEWTIVSMRSAVKDVKDKKLGSLKDLLVLALNSIKVKR
jgi:hypothetical protein